MGPMAAPDAMLGSDRLVSWILEGCRGPAGNCWLFIEIEQLYLIYYVTLCSALSFLNQSSDHLDWPSQQFHLPFLLRLVLLKLLWLCAPFSYILLIVVFKCCSRNFFMCSCLLVSFALKVSYSLSALSTFAGEMELVSYEASWILSFSSSMLSTRFALCLQFLYSQYAAEKVASSAAREKSTIIRTRLISPSKSIVLMSTSEYFSLMSKMRKEVVKNSKNIEQASLMKQRTLLGKLSHHRKWPMFHSSTAIRMGRQQTPGNSPRRGIPQTPTISNDRMKETDLGSRMDAPKQQSSFLKVSSNWELYRSMACVNTQMKLKASTTNDIAIVKQDAGLNSSIRKSRMAQNRKEGTRHSRLFVIVEYLFSWNFDIHSFFTLPSGMQGVSLGSRIPQKMSTQPRKTKSMIFRLTTPPVTPQTCRYLVLSSQASYPVLRSAKTNRLWQLILTMALNVLQSGMGGERLSKTKAGIKWTVKTTMRMKSAEPSRTSREQLHRTAGTMYFSQAAENLSVSSQVELTKMFLVNSKTLSLGPYSSRSQMVLFLNSITTLACAMADEGMKEKVSVVFF